jgi:hypothetical protein
MVQLLFGWKTGLIQIYFILFKMANHGCLLIDVLLMKILMMNNMLLVQKILFTLYRKTHVCIEKLYT